MEATPARLAIGALSQRTGCQVETIRYYERVGLLPAPARSPAGYRLYAAPHLKRLTFIRQARALGFSLDEVRRLLRLGDERRRPCAEGRVVAAAHLSDVRAKIAALRAMERVLAETVARCEAEKGSECPLIEALSDEHGTGRDGTSSPPEWRCPRPGPSGSGRDGELAAAARAAPTAAGRLRAPQPAGAFRKLSARRKKLPSVTTTSPARRPLRTE
jgi:MerR family mercuric resistance operon transcriptional regulator